MATGPRPKPVSAWARKRAHGQVALGNTYLHKDRESAAQAYRRALALDPGSSLALYNLGLIHKWDRDWEQAFDCYLQAAELIGPRESEPAWWNLGIAATALRRWDVARRAWRAYGLDIPDGDDSGGGDAGPIEADFGFTPVRLLPVGDGSGGRREVVWGQRIDPSRARIDSIPFPESGHRWGDIVLHDGSPNGYREIGGRTLPVFDELVRWEPSDVPTVQASVSATDKADVETLLQQITDAGHAAEDWTRNVRTLCASCSEGIVHAEHTDDALASGTQHYLGIAAPLATATDLVTAWADSPGRTLHTLTST
jgi:tetratricopeptide (TPR) repeat protein